MEPTDADTYLAAVPEPFRTALEDLRSAIQAAAPEATETMSYSMPAFRAHGRVLVSYAAFKDHCSLFPMSMRVIDMYAEELKPYQSGKGTLRFHPDDPIPSALVQRIVEARLAENLARSRR